MKLVTSGLLVILPCAISIAQEGRRGGPPRTSPVFAALDTNGDGSISAAERKSAPASLKSLDKNSDGRLTEDEIRPQFGPGGGGPLEGARGERRPGGPGPDGRSGDASGMMKTLLEFDRDGNGSLSKEEVPERMQGLFARGDSNKDGVLDGAELKAMTEAQTASAPQDREAGPGRPGGRGPGGFMRFDRLIAAIDTDKDGVLSADEIAKSADALKVLDADGDGAISLEEARPNMGPGRGRDGGPDHD